MFAKRIEMSKATIIRIGTSHGVIIPSTLLKKAGFRFRDAIEITEDRGHLVISTASAESDIITEPFTGPFAELKSIRNLPGSDFSIEEIRRSRHNSTTVEW